MPLTIKESLNSRLHRIANVLLLNASFTNNLGLLNGKMGVAIFFFHYARYTGNKVYEQYAGELIDEIYEDIDLTTPVDFANGLTGIGWGIEYIVQNRFVEADTDEALEEIDSRVYRNMLNSPLLIENEEDIFSYGLYYLARLKYRKDDDNITTLNIKAILVHLVDECERIFIHNRFLEYNLKCITIKPMLSVLYFLSEVHQLGVSPNKVQKCLMYMPPFIKHSLNEDVDSYDKSVLLGLLDKFTKQTNNNIDNVLQTSIKIVQESQYTKEDELLNCTSFTQKWYNIALPSELTGIAAYDPEFFKAFEILDNEADWNLQLTNLNTMNLGLTGMAGMGWWLLNKGTSFTNIKIKEIAL